MATCIHLCEQNSYFGDCHFIVLFLKFNKIQGQYEYNFYCISGFSAATYFGSALGMCSCFTILYVMKAVKLYVLLTVHLDTFI